MKNDYILGASFSHPHLLHLGCSLNDALHQYSQLGLKHIRLGCYWTLIEKKPNTYDFSQMDTLVNTCEKLGIHITMTIGMKAPRYPEYYIPSWLLSKVTLENNTFLFEDNLFYNALFTYIEAVVVHFKKNTQIKYWQIENEPLDPSGPNWWKIDYALLKREVDLVKSIDPSKSIVINLWGNALQQRNYYGQIIPLADVVGLDLYSRVPDKNVWGNRVFNGPHDTDLMIMHIIEEIKAANKKVWISELQAEPWADSESCLPQHVIENTRWISDWHVDGVFFWGFEYWYAQKMKKHTNYWEAAKKAISLLN